MEPFAFLVLSGVLATLVLARFYGAKSHEAASRPGHARLGRWDFSPETLGGFSYPKLMLVSVLGLFLELLMIRWISSEIRVFAYFKNFVLIACFLGFGLGCYLCRRRINLLAMTFPLMTLVLLVKLPWARLRELLVRLPALLGVLSEVHVWGVPSMPLNSSSILVMLAAVAVIVPLFALVAFVFIPVGQLVGWYLENARRGITAYSANILGSLVGILLYTLLCFLYQPPAVWFALAGAMLIVLLLRQPRLAWLAALALAFCVGFASLGPGGGSVLYWSPYQKLTLTPRREAGKTLAYELSTNDSWYQQILDLSAEFVASHPRYFPGSSVRWNAYNLPYRFYPQPPAVLVLGAGMGNDVAGALRSGASRVVAVEIDPLILKLGQQLHFEKPYSSTHVHVVLDDARSYVQNSSDRFDLILFSLLDSHTTSSHFTNIRIDNYVYTLEALRAAKRLLNPDGVFVVKFQVDTPWIAGRLSGLLQEVFGRPPLQLQTEYSDYTTGGRFFISGSPERVQQALADPELAAYVAKHSKFKMESASLTTDDWPYFYQHEPGLPASVIAVSLVLVLLCWMLMRHTGTTGRSLRWHFFFLGAGFLLLEAQIVSKMALLFGTTWLVNSIVIAGLLLLIVASNALVEWRPKIPAAVGYAGIFASILVAYLVPLEKFFFASLPAKMVSATAVLCLPVFFAGIVFIRSFAQEGFRGEALGSNLLGALVGGLLESLSLWTGIRSLLAMAALLYLASWLALRLSAPVPAGIGLRATASPHD